ncbi:hybrid sensor histidine kinase/response regulator [Magnetofaba australis]|uniref:histidine kinase n=1 Tax=Magnetofaba australis IT-1 TaxID=1434232 RepID=A0A1Y2KB45_9PROT|nr:hybrid sensor histidine kinase/response regulator [Magnetofaba australis]OSM07035.1 putative two-component hybrid sensor and regulator [Magnetofaba australis IT-1]
MPEQLLNKQPAPRILIVDDQPTNIHALYQIVQSEGDVFMAASGEKALEHCAHTAPDLILLDVEMPGLDGYETCRRLKADKALAHIPVIFITAHTTEEDEVRALEAGAVDFITKPINALIVRARVRTHIQLKQAHNALTEQAEAMAARNQILEENVRLREDVDRITRHDLKSPLSRILGFCELLLDECDGNDDTAEMLQAIHRAARQAMNQANSTLVLFKIENGDYAVRYAPVDLMQVIREVWDGCAPIANAKDVTLSGVSADAAPFLIQAEESLCYTLFGNLLQNAAEAAPSNSCITVTLERHDAEAMIRIHNHGQAPEAIRARFFEKYATAGKKDGTGLGAYSARLMARAHHGDIEMQSSAEHGVTLTVRLPITPPPASL